MHDYDIAVIGGGASGTLFVAELLRHQSGQRVLWLTGDDSVGAAYSSAFDSHLLNVSASRMSAFIDQPRHFHEWLNAHCGQNTYAPSDYVPRHLYGRYLTDLKDGAKTDPRLHCHPKFLSRLEKAGTTTGRAWRLFTSEGETFDAERLVIATGLSGVPRKSGEGDSLILDPWKWFRERTPGWIAPPADREIIVVGSGLTSMDVIVGLRDLGFRGKIRVKSRSGSWSAQHEIERPLTPTESDALLAELLAVPGCRAYVKIFRRFAESHPWRSVIDALRPRSQDLWSALPLAEQHRFLRHVFPIWNRHRHRAPTQTAERILRDDQVSIERGRWSAGGCKAALVFDCRGLGLASSRVWPPFLMALEEYGDVSVGPLGLGVATEQPESVVVLGALRFGVEFECTAIPEIRSQVLAAVQAWTRS